MGDLPGPLVLMAFILALHWEEGQEDQGEVKEVGGPPSCFKVPGPPCLPSGYCLGSLELPQSSFRKAVFKGDPCGPGWHF